MHLEHWLSVEPPTIVWKQVPHERRLYARTFREELEGCGAGQSTHQLCFNTMRFLKSCLVLLAPLLSAILASAFPAPKPVCNASASGKGLQAAQQAAIDDFAHIILELKDAHAAFDKYAPGLASICSPQDRHHLTHLILLETTSNTPLVSPSQVASPPSISLFPCLVAQVYRSRISARSRSRELGSCTTSLM